MVYAYTYKYLVVLFFCLLSIHVAGQNVVINEFMADNEESLQDRDGDYSDWIELYNKEEYPVNLNAYALSDNISNLRKWPFPDVIIPARGHLLIFASGKNYSDGVDLHTNFRISADGEKLFLTNNQGILIDSTRSLWLSADEAYGRYPDGSNNWFKTFDATPGSTNNTVNHLVFSSEDGFYTSPFILSIQSIMGDSVRYTLDGSEPDAGSDFYKDSIYLGYKYDSENYFSEIPSTPDDSVIGYAAWRSPDTVLHKAQVVRSASFRNGVRTSKIYTHTFFVDSTIVDKFSFPVVSLVTDEKNLFDFESGIYLPGIYFDPSDPAWTGNYYQSGTDWERPVHITYFETDGTPRFSQDAGIRIHGFKSRAIAQKSFRLYARQEYGLKHFNFNLLPNRENQEYKRFLLRTTMGDWWNSTLINDILAHDLARGLDLEYKDYNPAVIYLNGEYWGIYFIRDRIDERYISYLYGYDKDSLDIINGNFGLVDAGTNNHYIKLAEYIDKNDLEQEANYEYVTSQIDIHNFIDYYIAETFFANMDWPGNNQKLWRPRIPGGKWRWILYDIDAGFGDVNTDMFTHSLADADKPWNEMPVSTFLFKNLLKNKSFVDLFLARYAEVLNNEFQIEAMSNKLHNIKLLIEDEIPDHVSRWNYPASVSLWNDNVQNGLLEFISKRACVVEEHINLFFDSPDFNFTCNTNISVPDNPVGDIRIAPNPNNGSFSVYNFSEHTILDELLRIEAGEIRSCTQNKIALNKGEQIRFDFKLLPGIYFIKYNNQKGTYTDKLIINH